MEKMVVCDACQWILTRMDDDSLYCNHCGYWTGAILDEPVEEDMYFDRDRSDDE